jgi:rubrerythrin
MPRTNLDPVPGAAPASASRRRFLRRSTMAAVGAASGVMMHDLALSPAAAQGGSAPTVGGNGVIDLGGGDLGVLNYAYALEQLEAAFYTRVIQTPYRGMNRTERALLEDLRDHEIAHRETFKTALGGNRIPDLQVNFSAIDFSSRQSVLTTARTFEDLGVAAYNGGGAAIRSPEILVLAGKIVSVEARHAATIRTLLNPGSTAFAGDDVVNLLGLDQALPPSQVLAAAAPFIATPVSAKQLP